MKLSALPIYCATLLLICLSGCCGDTESYCVNVNNSTLTVYDNKDSIATVAGDTPILPDAFFLQLYIDNETKVCYNRKTRYFFNAAYAMSCPQDEYHLRDSINNVVLTCNLPYTTGYPAGAVLNDLFALPPKYQGYPSADKFDFNTADENPAFRLYPQQSPVDTGAYIFTINLYMSDGTVMETSTDPVKFAL